MSCRGVRASSKRCQQKIWAVCFLDTVALRYLSSHLRRRVTAALPDARFYTSADSAMSIGITTIELPDVSSDDLQKRLRERHRILTQSMADNTRAPEIRGLRITADVYTTPAQIDRLVAALKAG